MEQQENNTASYQVDLEVFNGPMDLLLYLIAKEEVDIQEVSIAPIVDQYMEYLEKMKELNVDITSDFIVMASTLMLIKSKALLPTEEIDLEEEIDQQGELIQHLLEYKKIKVLSRGLQDRADLQNLKTTRPHQSGVPGEDWLPEEELNLWDIIKAFAKIVKETSLDRTYKVVHTDKPISAYIASILDILDRENTMSFEGLFIKEKTRSEAISLFLGVLELVRRNVISVVRGNRSDDLQVKLCIDVEELRSIKEDGIYQVDRLNQDSEDEANTPESFFEQELPMEENKPLPAEPLPEEGFSSGDEYF